MAYIADPENFKYYGKIIAEYSHVKTHTEYMEMEAFGELRVFMKIWVSDGINPWKWILVSCENLPKEK